MYLSPSKILYTNCIELGAFPEFPSQDCLLKVTRTIQKGGAYPRLQVVKKDGYYFTLNDTQLRLYRYLEKVGQCGSVQVDKVPLREVPEGIRNLMRVPDSTPKSNPNQKQKGKYHSIGSKDGNSGSEILVGSENSSEDEEEASSENDDSDEEESEWSDDEENVSDTDVNSSTQENDDDDAVAENESFI